MYEEVLTDWNFWGNFDIDFIKRDIDVSKFVSSKYVLTLFGVRRSGKSYIAYGFLKEQIKSGIDPNKTLILNLEDPRLKFLTAKELIRVFEEYEKITGAKRPFVVLDEIQNIKGWESFARFLTENKKCRVIVTGSSSNLMSKEYGTVLTGRHIDIHVLPLSFKEYLTFKGVSAEGIEVVSKRQRIKKHFDEFTEWGGFPEIALTGSKEKRKRLLGQYLGDIQVKDISSRFRIKDHSNIEKLSNFLVSNPSSTVNLRKLSRSLEIPLSTIYRFMEYFRTADLLFLLKKFSFKAKEVERSFKKMYLVDVGFHSKMSLKFSRNEGKILENIVFL